MNMEFELKKAVDPNIREWTETYGEKIPAGAVYRALGLNQTARGLEKTFKEMIGAWEKIKDSYPGAELDTDGYESRMVTVWDIVFEDGSTRDPLTLFIGPATNLMLRAEGSPVLEKELTGYFGRVPYGFRYGNLETLFLE